MRLPLTLLTLAVLVPSSSMAGDSLPDLPDWVFVVPPEDENLDVIHFGENRPTLIQFRIRINGQGFRSAFDTSLARLHQYVDADDDGILTDAELGRTNWQRVVAFVSGDFTAFTETNRINRASGYRSSHGRISVDAFREFVQAKFSLDPVRVQVSHSANPVHQAVFNQFDRNRDGFLSMDELTPGSADAIVKRLDRDEDEMVDRAELQPDRSPLADSFGFQSGTVVGDAMHGPLLALTSAESRGQAVQRLLGRYDTIDGTSRDGRLSPVEAGFAPETFLSADVDAGGQLDRAELGRFLEAPRPVILLDVRLARTPGTPPTIETDPLTSTDPRLARKADLDWKINLDGRTVQVSPNDGVSDNKSAFDARFELSDTDKDGSIDRTEATKGFYFSRIFDAVDRNGDGRMTKVEASRYLATILDLRMHRATLQISEEGRPIFETLDTNQDGRLGRRELRKAPSMLKPFDRDGDGRIGLDEFPMTVRLQVGRGDSNASRGASANYADSESPEPPGGSKIKVAWFRKMDRNRDGDVSPAEFLGTIADFRKLDADGDGLIDEQEAAKGP